MGDEYRLEQWAEDAIDALDAGVFSSDAFFDVEAIARFRDFMARWERGLKEIEESRLGDEDEPT